MLLTFFNRLVVFGRFDDLSIISLHILMTVQKCELANLILILNHKRWYHSFSSSISSIQDIIFGNYRHTNRLLNWSRSNDNFKIDVLFFRFIPKFVWKTRSLLDLWAYVTVDRSLVKKKWETIITAAVDVNKKKCVAVMQRE